MIDLAEIIERLVPQASYGTAKRADIDADDYAALVRTWGDSRTIPTRVVVDATRDAIIAEQQAADQARTDRRAELLTALQNDPGQITIGEISAIDSLATAKVVMLKMNRSIRLLRAIAFMLRNRDDITG